MHANSLRGNGAAYDWPSTHNSVVKVIANRALSAPAAIKGLAYFFNTLPGVLHPGPGLPRWLVTQMLSMATRQLGHPVPVLVLMETGDRRSVRASPFVRVPFAFGQILV
ncbi:DUF4158 domain-containing protein [Pseudomonas brassicacearum]